MAIGNVILELRKERNLSQKKLADVLGVSQSAIAQIENNRNEATASTIRKLAAFFEVSADYLLGLEDDFGTKKTDSTYALSVYSKEEQQLIENYRTLTPPLKKMINDTIKTFTTSEEVKKYKGNIS